MWYEFRRLFACGEGLIRCVITKEILMGPALNPIVKEHIPFAAWARRRETHVPPPLTTFLQDGRRRAKGHRSLHHVIRSAFEIRGAGFFSRSQAQKSSNSLATD